MKLEDEYEYARKYCEAMLKGDFEEADRIAKEYDEKTKKESK